MMITITGTPVHLTSIKRNSDKNNCEENGSFINVPGEKIYERINSSKWEEKLTGLPVISIGPPIKYLIENAAIIPANRIPYVVNSLKNTYKYDASKIAKTLTDTAFYSYLSNYDEKELSDAFSEYLFSVNQFSDTFWVVFKRVFTPDYMTVFKYLTTVNPSYWREEMIIASANRKSSYTADDIRVMKEICSVIKNTLEKTAGKTMGILSRSGVSSEVNDKLNLLVDLYQRIVVAYEELTR